MDGRLILFVVLLHQILSCAAQSGRPADYTEPSIRQPLPVIALCEPANISWVGGAPPYKISFGLGPVGDQTETELFEGISDSWFVWTPDIGPGKLGISLEDVYAEYSDVDGAAVESGASTDCSTGGGYTTTVSSPNGGGGTSASAVPPGSTASSGSNPNPTQPNTQPNPTQSSNGNNGLDTGAIVGAAIGAVGAVLAAIIAGLFACGCGRAKRSGHPDQWLQQTPIIHNVTNFFTNNSSYHAEGNMTNSHSMGDASQWHR